MGKNNQNTTPSIPIGKGDILSLSTTHKLRLKETVLYTTNRQK
jgi:hypothetical protein